MRSVGWRAYALPVCLLSVAVVYWAIVAVVSVANIPPRGSDADFAHFYAAARAVRMGVGPGLYSSAVIARSDQLPGGCASSSVAIPYLNPPLLAVLFQPLTALPCGDAFRLWRMLSLALWAGITTLLARQVWRRCIQLEASLPASATAATFIVALSAFSFPILDGLWLGQMHLLILAGIVLAEWLHERNRAVAAGMLLAFITLIKLVPAVLIVYFLLRRDWRVLAGAALGSVLLLSVVLVGSGGLPTLAAMIPMLTLTSGHLWNNEAVITLHPVLGPALVAGAALAFAVTVVLQHRMRRAVEDAVLGYAWAISTMLLISPIVWLNYLTWLLPAVAVQLPHVLRRKLTVGLAVAILTLLIIQPVLIASLVPGFGLTSTVQVAMLLCWTLTGVLYVQRPKLTGLHRQAIFQWLLPSTHGRHSPDAEAGVRRLR
jgi:hypothetical protein